MGAISQWEIIIRLVLALILASLIGLERESHGRPAGLRTHILVGLGSCLIMIVSIYGFSAATYDPSRLAAQVVSGIGFLGAGTILREGVSVKGLTTAASLWIVSGIGLAVGGGLYLPALLVTLFSVFTLVLLEPLEKRLFVAENIHLEIVLTNDSNSLSNVVSAISAHRWPIKHLELEQNESPQTKVLDIIIETKDSNKEHYLAQLEKINGVCRVTWK